MFRRLLPLLFLIACGEATRPPLPLAGSYELVSSNGGSLPQALSTGPTEILQLTGGTITLRSDGTFTDVTRSRHVILIPPPGSFSDSESTRAGTYSRADSTVTLVDQTGSYTLTFHADGSLTRFFDRSVYGGQFLDVTYRYQKH